VSAPVGYGGGVLGLLLVAVSLGMSNFAASAGIGAAGADGRTRLRLAVVFGIFEAGMPLVGLLLGHDLARDLGAATRWTDAGLLVATGAWTLLQGARHRNQPGAGRRPAAWRGGRLIAAGLVLSLDNLAVGFALGTYHVSLLLAVIVIGAVSVTLSMAGLELGNRLGAKTGPRAGYLSGALLVAVGIAVALGIA
jgi:manganese efflux pump family protein